MSILPTLLPSYTYEDYKIWEGEWELIEGIPYAMAPKPMIRHQRLETFIWKAFDAAFEECESCEVLAEVDWKVDEKTVVAPDVVVVCDEEGDTHLTKAPKIIVEILSKSTEQKDRVIKFELYQEEGVLYYIIVSTDILDFEIYRLQDGKYLRDSLKNKKYPFSFEGCEKEVDFSDIFKKMAKSRV